MSFIPIVPISFCSIPLSTTPIAEEGLVSQINHGENLFKLIEIEQIPGFLERNSSKITSLNLENCFFDDDTSDEQFIETIAKIAKTRALNNLEVLNVSLKESNFDRVVGEALGSLLETTSNLVTFGFFNPDSDETSSASFLAMISGFRHLHKLTDLTIEYGMNNEDLAELVKLFFHPLNLVRLKLIATEITDAGILGKNLIYLQNLTDLYLGLFSQVRNFPLLANTLVFIPNLKKLTIHGSKISRAIPAFGLAFKHHPALINIKLTYITFPIEELKSLVSNLEYQPNIEVLSFDHSCIEDGKEEAVKAIAALIRTLPSIRKVYCKQLFGKIDTEALKKECAGHPKKPTLILQENEESKSSE